MVVDEQITDTLDTLHQDALEFIRRLMEQEGHSGVLVGVTMLSMGSVLLTRLLGENGAAEMVESLRHRLPVMSTGRQRLH